MATDSNTLPNMLTPDDLARYFRISKTGVYRLVEKRLIPFYRVGGSLRFSKNDTLRHTFASHLAMAGGSLKAIKELLGHSDIQTTMRYLHLAPSALKETIGLLKYTQISPNRGQPAVNRQENLTKTVEIIAPDNPLLLAKVKQKQPPKRLLETMSG